MQEAAETRAQEVQWDEFKDKACTDWKRVRSAIEHENTLINHRLSWLFTSQLFLFGGFAAVFQTALKDQLLVTSLPVQVVLFGLSVVAMSMCIFIIVGVDAAHRQIESLENWWFVHHLYDQPEISQPGDVFKIDKLTGHPPINGIFDEWLYQFLSTRWIPVPIIIGWLTLDAAVLFNKVLDVRQPVVWTLAVTMAVYVVGHGIFKLLKMKRVRLTRNLGRFKDHG